MQGATDSGWMAAARGINQAADPVQSPGQGPQRPSQPGRRWGGWRAQRQRQTQTWTKGDNTRTKECIV
ncbi:hypothetical protein K523DRAFT_380462 [Schizophyllum commune Tattone D]|nr:hypothetical protein K523DRAFT_380462 [Schizophyllum commune Tattone D]